MRKPKYGIVLHAVPTHDLDSTNVKEHTMKYLEQENHGKDIHILKVAPLRRRPRDHHSPTKHNSVIVYMDNAEAADKCIKTGFYINHARYMPEKYTPQLRITQCFNCQAYGHLASQCKHKPACGKCGGEHTTRECNSVEFSCIGCGGDHPAWHHECPKRIEVSKKRAETRRKTSTYFNE